MFSNAAFGQNVFLERVEPVVENGPQGAVLGVRCRKALGKAPVYRLQPVQRRLRFGDLDLCGGKALTLRPFLQPTYKEGLAAAVFAAHGLESPTARRHRSQLLVQRRIERIKTNCEQIETLARHRSAPEGVDDLAASQRADHRWHLRVPYGSSGGELPYRPKDGPDVRPKPFSTRSRHCDRVIDLRLASGISRDSICTVRCRSRCTDP